MARRSAIVDVVEAKDGSRMKMSSLVSGVGGEKKQPECFLKARICGQFVRLWDCTEEGANSSK